MRLRLALLIMACAMPAHSETRCKWVGEQWVCRQALSPGEMMRDTPRTDFGAVFQRSYERAEATRRAAEPTPVDAEAIQAAAREGRAIEVRKIVGEMVADGKCAEAKRFALSEGDLNLAEQSQRLCPPP